MRRLCLTPQPGQGVSRIKCRDIIQQVAPKQVPPIRLIPEATTDEGRALLQRPPYVWEELGQRHQIGGSPELRNSDWPTCTQCAEPMTFYAQLDGLPGSSELDLADAGLIYVYVCFGCFEVSARLDSY